MRITSSFYKKNISAPNFETYQYKYSYDTQMETI